jgi:hypothetical protein
MGGDLMECKYCGTIMAVDSAYALGVRMETAAFWDYWEDRKEGFSTEIEGVGTVLLVAKSVTHEERHYGGDADVFLIFLIDGQLYRKSGVSNSYGEVIWDGPFRNAVEKITEVKVYE